MSHATSSVTPVERRHAQLGLAPPRPVFIGGCPRSGTTLLGAMLGVGPQRLAVPESTFKFRLLPLLDDRDMVASDVAVERLAADPLFRLWDIPLPPARRRSMTFEDLIMELVRSHAAQAGKAGFELWIDHTPGNLRHAHALARTFEQAKFVNLIRDGRAVAASLLPLDWGPNTVAGAGAWWSHSIALGLAAERALGHDRVLTIRFEDLLLQPAATLRSICSFIGTTYDERMVQARDFHVGDYTAGMHDLVARGPDPGRIDAWRRELPSRSVEFFEAETHDLLALLGYRPMYGSRARRASRFERLRSGAEDLVRRGISDRTSRNRRLRRLQGSEQPR